MRIEISKETLLRGSIVASGTTAAGSAMTAAAFLAEGLANAALVCLLLMLMMMVMLGVSIHELKKEVFAQKAAVLA